jgi:hypothetical protein
MDPRPRFGAKTISHGQGQHYINIIQSWFSLFRPSGWPNEANESTNQASARAVDGSPTASGKRR